jgi:hypothetical protein
LRTQYERFETGIQRIRLEADSEMRPRVFLLGLLFADQVELGLPWRREARWSEFFSAFGGGNLSPKALHHQFNQ